MSARIRSIRYVSFSARTEISNRYYFSKTYMTAWKRFEITVRDSETYPPILLMTRCCGSSRIWRNRAGRFVQHGRAVITASKVPKESDFAISAGVSERFQYGKAFGKNFGKIAAIVQRNGRELRLPEGQGQHAINVNGRLVPRPSARILSTAPRYVHKIWPMNYSSDTPGPVALEK